MTGIVVLLLSALALYLLLYLRYRRIQARIRDTLPGRVQHSERLEPPKEVQPFLPGSRLQDRMADLGKELETLEVKPEVRKTPKKTAKRRSVVRSHADIRRSYIVDTLLERPKF